MLVYLIDLELEQEPEVQLDNPENQRGELQTRYHSGFRIKTKVDNVVKKV